MYAYDNWKLSNDLDDDENAQRDEWMDDYEFIMGDNHIGDLTRDIRKPLRDRRREQIG